MIRAFGWNIEFLTGGYGIYPFDEIVRIIKVCSQVLGKPLWVNLGTLEREQLEAIRPFTQGIVSSLETLNPELHKKVCPDKPIEPYLEMMQTARDLGFKQSFTLVIGLGETRDDVSYVKQLIKTYGFERVTVYALRPVRDTLYERGPSTEEMVWWIATLRTTFPEIEIIAGTAAHRIPEIDLLLRAGANAFTKLPATRLFNSEKADIIEQEVKDSGRTLTSLFQTDDVEHLCDWRGILSQTDLTLEEQEEAYQKLFGYLATMQKRREKRNAS
jgi:biotin synthase-like enzyme